MNQYSKLEKADILEMTVKHLRQLQRHHVTQALSHDPTLASKYKAGFNECAGEVVRYLGSLHEIDGATRERLISHLGNVVTSVNHQSRDEETLNVQIPQHMNKGSAGAPADCLLMPVGVQTSPILLQSSALEHAQVPPASPMQHGSHTNSRIRASFQLVPNASSSLYLGHTQQMQQCSNTVHEAVPLYRPTSRTPTRTKASLKAYDDSAFSKITENHGQVYCQGLDFEKKGPPVSQKCLENHMDYQLHNVVVGYGRTPSPLKVEDVWRPW